MYIALGSNIEPQTNLKAAAQHLRMIDPTASFSSVYETAPMGHTDQDPFLNAVCRIDTTHNPQSLIEQLQTIEQDLHKDTPFENGPRTIDLDLLLYDDLILNEENLAIPHPRMHERRFVLEPLRELIDAESLHPVTQRTWGELLRETKGQDCTKLEFTLNK